MARLRKRLTNTVTPLLKERKRRERDRDAEREFSAISLNERRRRLSLIGVRHARSAGFWNEGTRNAKRFRAAEVTGENAWLGYKPWRRFTKTLLLVIGEITKGDLKAFESEAYSLMSKVVPAELRDRMNVAHVVLASLTPVPSARIEAAIPDLLPLKAPDGTRMWARPHGSTDGRLGGPQVMYFHLIDRVRSEHRFAELCRELFRWMGRGRPTE